MKVGIIGGGPAGLMAAETVRAAGAEVNLYDAMASLGRKFLLAGKGGLNLTHAEPVEAFLLRYGSRRIQIEPLIKAFGPEALREWVHALGIKTFAGTSGRIFPNAMKSAPLLRAWLRRLRAAGVQFHVRHRWTGWNEHGALSFVSPQGPIAVRTDATILALGGGSWPGLGSDAAWVPFLKGRGVLLAPLRPANCGFDVNWSEHVRTKYSGHPVKSVCVMVKNDRRGESWHPGEFVITHSGIEGGVIYAVSAALRDEITREGVATLWLDLAPERDVLRLTHDLSRPRGKRTMASHLQRYAHIEGIKAALLREVIPKQDFTDPARLAAAIKKLPLRLVAPRPLEEAISTAGGVRFEALDDRLMIKDIPGVFCAGEMLDWEAPTGGYLLTACFSTGHAAGAGAVAWLNAARDI
jgi:uncharacterized flavoprotein (TIGR03862 family)